MVRSVSKGHIEPESTVQRGALGMSKRQVLLANAVIVLLITGSLLTVVFDKEYWPFSQYPMFSNLATGNVTMWLLYGVPQEEPQQEILLRDAKYIKPFNLSRLSAAFKRMDSNRDPEKRQQLLNEALLDSLNRYEELRLAKHHDGPALQSIRLYKVQWQIDAQGQNIDQPNQRELIAEVDQQ